MQEAIEHGQVVLVNRAHRCTPRPTQSQVELGLKATPTGIHRVGQAKSKKRDRERQNRSPKTSEQFLRLGLFRCNNAVLIFLKSFHMTRHIVAATDTTAIDLLTLLDSEIGFWVISRGE